MGAFFFENHGNAVQRGSGGTLHGAPNMTNIRILTTGDHFMTRVTLFQSGITTKISMVCRRYPRYRIFHPLISCSLPQRKPCHNISWKGQDCQFRDSQIFPKGNIFYHQACLKIPVRIPCTHREMGLCFTLNLTRK